MKKMQAEIIIKHGERGKFAMDNETMMRSTLIKFLPCKSHDLAEMYKEKAKNEKEVSVDGKNIKKMNEPIMETISKENVQFEEGMIPDADSTKI